MAFGVPVKVSVALSLAQIVVELKLTLAVGLITVRVIVWFRILVQLGAPDVVTLTKDTVVLAAYVPISIAFPNPSNTMV